MARAINPQRQRNSYGTFKELNGILRTAVATLRTGQALFLLSGLKYGVLLLFIFHETLPHTREVYLIIVHPLGHVPTLLIIQNTQGLYGRSPKFFLSSYLAPFPPFPAGWICKLHTEGRQCKREKR